MSKDDTIKNEIVKNAARLFQKYGYNKTTIEDIAKASGKGKSSLYYYFGDKEKIFVEVITREMNTITAYVDEQIKGCSSVEEQLTVYIETYIKEYAKYGNIYNIVLGEILENRPFFKRFATKLDEIQINSVTEILQSGVKNREFRLPEGMDITLVARIIVNSIEKIQLNLTILNFDDNKTNLDISGIMTWLFLNGLKGA